MSKKVLAQVKLQIAAGKATPAPPVGTALGPHGLNIMDFCKAFNAKTAAQDGLIIPAVVTVYADRSYSFITKTPPAAVLLKKVFVALKVAVPSMYTAPPLCEAGRGRGRARAGSGPHRPFRTDHSLT